VGGICRLIPAGICIIIRFVCHLSVRALKETDIVLVGFLVIRSGAPLVSRRKEAYLRPGAHNLDAGIFTHS
jgi:hypothetical protein